MIPYFETHITEACNLNCRGCSHFSVLAKPKHKDLAEFEREYKRLAEIEEIHTMRLMGGEPLLNPNFMEYLRILGDTSQKLQKLKSYNMPIKLHILITILRTLFVLE